MTPTPPNLANGGPYHPAVVYTFGEVPGQQPIPMHHPGVSLRNEVALKVYQDLIHLAGSGSEDQVEPRDITQEADALALGAFIFADAFLRASSKKL